MIILIFPRFIYVTDYVTSNAPDFIISFVVTVTLLYNISLLKYRNNFSRKGRQEISSIDKTVACRSQEIQLRFFFSTEFISHTLDSNDISWIVWVWFNFQS